jgi:hypothetical protein
MVKTEGVMPVDEVVAEKQRLNAVLAKFEDEMRHRLAVKVAEGRRGWDDPQYREAIYNALLAHAAGVPLAAGQEADIANFAMFLWYQRLRPPLPEPVVAAVRAA